MLNKNLNDLETIQEKAVEEEAAVSVGGFPLKNIDIDESYSFSLRNFNYNRPPGLVVP